jgi:protein SCO1/2
MGASIRRWGGTCFAIVLMGALLSACQPYRFKGTEYLDPRPAPDFDLAKTSGGDLRLSDQAGRVVILFFGYTSCADVCPATLADANRILTSLGADAPKAEYLFVTVDPERDTLGVLKKYLSIFNPAIVGLTGAPDALAKVWGDYGIFVEKIPPENGELGYSVNHTARIFVIDKAGRLRLSYSFGTPYQDILDDLRALLRE